MQPQKRKLKLKEMKINKQILLGLLFLAFMMALPAQAADEADRITPPA